MRPRSARRTAAAALGCPARIASRTVAKVWTEVLQAAPQGLEEDFFRSGRQFPASHPSRGPPRGELQRELSLSVLGEAPSFGGLCEALRRPRVDHGSSLVLLKPGEGSPPLYLVHGIGGQAAELLVAARCMSYPGPVFGIQARGLRLLEPPHLSVQTMAAHYLRQIRARLPAGALPPVWHLCGYSFGGLVAFEMACQLRGAGQVVGLLGLLDTLPRPLSWRLTAWPPSLERSFGRFS